MVFVYNGTKIIKNGGKGLQWNTKFKKVEDLQSKVNSKSFLMEGCMGGWVDRRKSRFKDCLQQSKVIERKKW